LALASREACSVAAVGALRVKNGMRNLQRSAEVAAC
jgi:hypothetical protein